VVKELMIRNATIDSEDFKRRTPLSYGIIFHYSINLNFIILYLLKASGNGHMEVVKALLNHNAIIDLKDNSGRTPLSFGLFLIYLIN
jgi:ankyrin repeat protein